MTYPFVQASHYTNASRGKGDIKFIVFHDMEMAEKSTTAEGCAAYFARSTTGASSHYTVDSDSIVQCVKDEDVAWCAPGANSTGLHLEHAGFASQTRGDWLDEFGKAMLARSAQLVAAKCREYGIPVRKGDYTDIRANRPCIVGHWDVTKAFPDKGSHTDPGSNFPWDYYIGLVKAAYDGTPLEDDMPTVDEVWAKQIRRPNNTPVSADVALSEAMMNSYGAERAAKQALATAGALSAIVTKLAAAQAGQTLTADEIAAAAKAGATAALDEKIADATTVLGVKPAGV